MTVVHLGWREDLSEPAIISALDLLDEVGSRRERAGDSENGPGRFRRETQIHHDGPHGPQHVDVDGRVRGGPRLLDNGRHQFHIFAGHIQFPGPFYHAFGGGVLEHQVRDAKGFVVEVVVDDSLGDGVDVEALRPAGREFIEQTVAEGGVGAVGVTEGVDRGAAGLGEEGLALRNQARHGGRGGKPILQRHDHHVVEHLVFFARRNAGLEVDEQHVGHAVTLFHQLGRVVTARDDPVDVLIGDLGTPLETGPGLVDRDGAVLALAVIEWKARVVQVADSLLVGRCQITHFLYSPSSFCFLAYS